jgi:periplasmic protein TonB
VRVSSASLAIACLAIPLAAGCASTVPQPTVSASHTTDAPVVWSSTVGGCTKPTHAPFPEYGTEVPFIGPPTPTRKVDPVYPAAARGAGVQGTVKLAVLVCEHGRVVATKVIESVPELDVAATDCVRQWDFSPASTRRDRIAAWTIVPIRFSLR